MKPLNNHSLRTRIKTYCGLERGLTTHYTASGALFSHNSRPSAQTSLTSHLLRAYKLYGASSAAAAEAERGSAVEWSRRYTVVEACEKLTMCWWGARNACVLCALALLAADAALARTARARAVSHRDTHDSKSNSGMSCRAAATRCWCSATRVRAVLGRIH